MTAAPGHKKSKNYTLVTFYRIGDPYEVPDDLAGCGHPWHPDDAQSNPGWCHPTHHGNCNELTEQGYVLDADGAILEDPPELVARREAHLAEILNCPPVTGDDAAAPWARSSRPEPRISRSGSTRTWPERTTAAQKTLAMAQLNEAPGTAPRRDRGVRMGSERPRSGEKQPDLRKRKAPDRVQNT